MSQTLDVDRFLELAQIWRRRESYVPGSSERRGWMNASGTCAADLEAEVERLRAAQGEKTLTIEPIKLDDQFLGHLREAAYDWGIEELHAEVQPVARRAAVWFGRCIVTLIDEVRRLRAPAPQGEQEPPPKHYFGASCPIRSSAPAPLPAPTAERWTGLMTGFAPADMDFSTTNSGDVGGPLTEKP